MLLLKICWTVEKLFRGQILSKIPVLLSSFYRLSFSSTCWAESINVLFVDMSHDLNVTVEGIFLMRFSRLLPEMKFENFETNIFIYMYKLNRWVYSVWKWVERFRSYYFHVLGNFFINIFPVAPLECVLDMTLTCIHTECWP
jgi:hypothetical protein